MEQYKVVDEVYAKPYGANHFVLLRLSVILQCFEGYFYDGDQCYWISPKQQKGLKKL